MLLQLNLVAQIVAQCDITLKGYCHSTMYLVCYFNVTLKCLKMASHNWKPNGLVSSPKTILLQGNFVLSSVATDVNGLKLESFTRGS